MQKIAEYEERNKIMEERMKEMESRYLISDELMSIFDSSGAGVNNHFGMNSIESLEYSLLGPDSVKSRLEKFMTDENVKTEAISKNLTITEKKKPLPILVESGDEKENLKLLTDLVKKFFDPMKLNYFAELFAEFEIHWFLNNHKHIDSWNHDDEMMVLLSVLIHVVKEGLLHPERSVVKHPRIVIKGLVNYYFQISKTQQTESLRYMKSQVLLAEYFYYNYEFEKAWKMMFTMVSNAYAHGVHLSQGALWKKISYFEAILSCSTTRPNIIHGLTKIQVTPAEDPLREYEFMNILRDRNMSQIEAVVNGVQVKYQQTLQLDARFERYTNFLRSSLNQAKDLSQEEMRFNEKIYSILLICLSYHLKLHFEYYEHDRYSDTKTLELICVFSDMLEKFATGRVSTLREIFTGLDCHLYQFLLVFIKYVNYKTVLLFTKSHTSGSKNGHDELEKLEMCQQKILGVFDSVNDYSIKRALRAIELVRSVNFKDVNPTSVGGVPMYANDQLKEVLEDEKFLVALRDISELEPQLLFEDIENGEVSTEQDKVDVKRNGDTGESLNNVSSKVESG